MRSAASGGRRRRDDGGLRQGLGAPNGAVFVCAHGAGGHMADRGMLARRRALAARVQRRALQFPRPRARQQPPGPDAAPEGDRCRRGALREEQSRREADPRRPLDGRTRCVDARGRRLRVRRPAAARVPAASGRAAGEAARRAPAADHGADALLQRHPRRAMPAGADGAGGRSTPRPVDDALAGRRRSRLSCPQELGPNRRGRPGPDRERRAAPGRPACGRGASVSCRRTPASGSPRARRCRPGAQRGARCDPADATPRRSPRARGRG